MDSVREVPLAQVEPDAFHRVQFRGVGRQVQQRHIVRNGQIAAGVPSRSIEHHDGMLILEQCRCEAPQERVHRRGADGGQHQTEIAAGRGFDGGEEVGEGVALIDRPARPLSTQPAAAAGSALLAEPGFILEIQRDPLARMRPRRPGEGCGQRLF
jgi:hypothetical protein